MPHFALTPENLVAFCQRQNFQYELKGPRGPIGIQYQLLGVPTPLTLIPWEDRPMLTLAMTLPFKVPPAQKAAVSAALVTLNSMSYMGTWVLNTEKAEIYFRDTLITLDNQYSDEGLLYVAKVVVSSAEAMASPLYRIAVEGAPPESILPRAN